jgi:hypothetical protein
MKRNLLVFSAFLALTMAACAGPERPPCAAKGEIETVCGFRNPEDLEYVASASIVVVSNMRHNGPHEDGGYLSGFTPSNRRTFALWQGGASAHDAGLGDPNCSEAPAQRAFYPHGLTSIVTDERALVYVAAHAGTLGGREAIEIFELNGDGEEARLIWKACIPSPSGVQINDLAVSPDGLLLASNYLPDPSMRHSIAASIFRRPTGDVMTWTDKEGWRHLPKTSALMANGVALSADGQTIFYAETIAGRLHRRALDDPSGRIYIDLNGLPDNLSWTARGTLLVAVHTSASELFRCFLRAGACRASWSVYEIEPTTLSIKNVVAHSGDSIGAVATALDVDGDLLLSSVFDDRIGLVRAYVQ